MEFDPDKQVDDNEEKAEWVRISYDDPEGTFYLDEIIKNSLSGWLEKHKFIFDGTGSGFGKRELFFLKKDTSIKAVSYTHLTLPTTPYV